MSNAVTTAAAIRGEGIVQYLDAACCGNCQPIAASPGGVAVDNIIDHLGG